MNVTNCDERTHLAECAMTNIREINAWKCQPSSWGIFVYSVVIPTISALGIVGNVLILAVLGRKSLRASTYTYLAVLAGADLITCVLLLFSGLSKGIFWGKTGWLEFDTFVYLPVGSVSSNVAVLATVCVTLDRLVLVSGPLRCKPPKFCDDRIARKLMWSSLPIAIVCNIPYCFIYDYNDEGLIDTTEFFNSRYEKTNVHPIFLVVDCIFRFSLYGAWWPKLIPRWYDLQNWLQLLVFGLVPAIFLLIGNGIMIFSVGKVIRKRRIFIERNSSEGKCAREQARLTVTLVGIVFVFLVGEVPTHLASRKSAVSLLYAGDSTKVDEAFLERFRICATVLNAISSSASFVLYCLLSPQFLAHLKDLVNGVRDGPRKNKLTNCKQPPKIQRFAPNEGIDF